jgi:hypothetical protein
MACLNLAVDDVLWTKQFMIWKDLHLTA